MWAVAPLIILEHAIKPVFVPSPSCGKRKLPLPVLQLNWLSAEEHCVCLNQQLSDPIFMISEQEVT